ncbi:hypothetical protein GCM10020295_04640 [Streptomyces cinereospinus]
MHANRVTVLAICSMVLPRIPVRAAAQIIMEPMNTVQTCPAAVPDRPSRAAAAYPAAVNCTTAIGRQTPRVATAAAQRIER